MSTCEIRFSGGGVVADCHAFEAGGREIAATAVSDPKLARMTFDNMLTALGDADQRRDLARGLAQSLPMSLMSQLAESTEGRVLLTRALGELTSDLSRADNRQAVEQITTALKIGSLKQSAEFKNLDPTSRQTILDTLNYPLGSSDAADNLIALAKSPGFQAASPDTRKALLSALREHPGDAIFGDGLQKLAADSAFKRLNSTQQAYAIALFTGIAGGAAYQGRSGYVLGIGSTSPSEADKRAVLDNARRVVTSAGFNDVGLPSRLAIVNALAAHPKDAAYTGRLIKLIDDRGFRSMNDPAKQVNLINAYGSDKNFANGLDTVLGNSRYTALGPAERAKVLGDLSKLSGTKSYDDANAKESQAMVEIIGDISAQSAARPSSTALRNTLDQVLDGKIKIGLYERDPLPGGFFNWGRANSNGIYLNIEPRTRAAAATSNRYIDTLVHETNHKLNGTTDAGTADRFLDEYRAAVVGRETARGTALSPADQKRVIDNLVDGTNPDYSHLADLYKNDAKFKAAVDAMYAAVNGTTDARGTVIVAPVTVSPEDARQRLRSAGNDSDYLKQRGNLDNH